MLSADGQRVAFYSCASNLIAGFLGGTCNVYLYDVTSETLTLVSHASGAPATGGNNNSFDPAISADGSAVAFNSHAGNLSTIFDGNGNVDAYYYRVSDTFADYGDAPASYGVLLADDGPRHALSPLRLGSLVDTEIEGQPSAGATGDDSNGLDDEDGVSFGTLVKGRDNTVTVVTSQPGLLSAWIDLDGSGTFDAPDEQLLDDYITEGGSEPVTLTIPASATATATFARFRLCAEVGECNTPLGAAASGEVEDYAVTLVDAPAVLLSATDLAFGDQVVGTSGAALTLTVSNTGTADLTTLAPTLGAPDGGDFAVTGNTCLTPTAPGTDCTIGVVFTPTAAGIRAATLGFASNADGSPHEIALSGNGIAQNPAISVDTASLDFGSQPVGAATGLQAVTVTNAGNIALTVTGFTAAGDNPTDFALVNDTCTGTLLAVSESCTAGFTFTPGAPGERSATSTVGTDAAGISLAIALAGVGTQPGVSLTPPSIDFGPQVAGTSSAAQTVTLGNSGNSALTVLGISVSAGFARSHNCPMLLAPAEDCAIDVVFAPAASGPVTGTLAVTTSGPNGTDSVTLEGVGIAQMPAISVTGNPDFGNQPVGVPSAARTVTVTNTGNIALTVSGITVDGSDAADFALDADTCTGTLLAVSTNCTAEVTFTPAASGNRSANLTVGTDALAPSIFAVGGIGTQPGVSLTPATLNFGSQNTGTSSAAQTVTLTNTGNSALGIANIGVSGAYAQTNTCAASLAAGASCEIDVVFSPVGGGPAAGTLTVSSDAPAAPTVSLSGSGVLPPTPVPPTPAPPSSTPTPAPSVTPTPTPAPTATPTATPDPTAMPSASPTPTPSMTPTPSPTPAPPTAAPSSTPGPTPTPSSAPTPAPSVTPTPTPAPTATPTATPDPTAVPSASPTPTPSVTPTPSPTPGAPSSMTTLDQNGNPVVATVEDGSLAVLMDFRRIELPASARLPAGFDYPAGVFTFTARNVPPGGALRIALEFVAGTAPDAWIKCIGNDCAIYDRVSIAGDTVTLTLIDGGAGDSDGLANGVIVDPGAPAVRLKDGSVSSGGGAMGLLPLLWGALAFAWRRWRGLVAGLLLGALPLAVPATQPAEAKMMVNLRERADLSGQIMTVLQPGQRVGILEESGDVARVETHAETRGYVPLDYLRACEERASGDGECAETTTLLNVRSGRGAEHALVGRLRPGSRVEVLERSGNYASIHFRERVEGFVGLKRLQPLAEAMIALPGEVMTTRERAALVAGNDHTDEFPPEEPLPVTGDAPETSPPAPQIAEAPPAAVDAAVRADAPPAVEPRRGAAFLSPGTRLVVGASIGASSSTQKREDLQRDITKASPSALVTQFDGDDTAYEVFARFEFTPHWGMQVAYLNLGESGARIVASPSDAAAIASVAGDRYPVAGDGFTVDLRGKMSFGRASVSAAIGAFVAMDRDIDVQVDTQTVTATGPGAGLLLGVGYGYELAADWMLGVDARFIQLNDWTVVPSASLGYRF